MADPVVSVLLEKLVTFLVEEGSQLLEFDDQLDEIRKEFQYMQKYVKDADRVKRRGRSETLMQIMNDLRELIYNAEEIIADCEIVSRKKKKLECEGTSFSPSLLGSSNELVKKLKIVTQFSPFHSRSHRQLVWKLKHVNESVKRMKENMKSYLATIPVHAEKEEIENRPLTCPVLLSDDKIVGLEDKSREIIKSLLAKEDYLKVLGIVGMGGIGKTTLAWKICKTDVIETEFKPCIFVRVSQTFRFGELLKRILSKLDVANEYLRCKDEVDLLLMLKNKLDDCRYLIVLDDVWGVEKEEWWYKLGSNLPRGKGGSLMVTTRNEGVARSMGATDEHIYCVEILSERNSQLLFSKVVFERSRGISPNEELEKCGKEIVAECGGLPLTIRVVGGIMIAKGDSIIQWQQMAKNVKEEMASSKTLEELVNSKLELSYEELPTNVRPCLLVFAMFPEDYVLTSFQIIQMWIAEGLVLGRGEKTALEIGGECFNEIVNRCLMSKDEEEQFGSGIAYYKMHDAIREMLVKIATEDNFFSPKRTSKPSRRIVMHENIHIESNLTYQEWTLAVIQTKIETITPILERNVNRLRRLRILHIEVLDEIDNTVKSVKWWNEGSSLDYLVYLHLENVNALTTIPASIGDMHNLQILSLRNCRRLGSLPSSLTKLEKLIVLSVYGCSKLECLPNGLGKLLNLERLVCLMSNTASKSVYLWELNNLQKLKQLHMEITTKEQLGEEEGTMLKIPKSLQILVLSFLEVTPACEVSIANKINRPLCRSLQYLKELYLGSYSGESTPTWLSPMSLPNLCHLHITLGRIKKMGVEFFLEGSRWKVETLVLESLEELEDDWVIIERAMPSLRHAHVKDCPKLRYSEETFQPSHHGWTTWKKLIKGESSSFLAAFES